MACGDSNSSAHKVFRSDSSLNVFTWSDSSAGCEEPYTSSTYEFVLESTADDEYTPYNEVETTKRFYLYSMFTDLPESLLGRCNREYYRPEPISVLFVIHHPSGHTEDKFAFDNSTARPNSLENDGSLYDGLLNFTAAVVGGASGSVLGIAGAAAVKEFIDIDSSDPINLNQGYYNNTKRQQWSWEMDINGETPADFPQDACGTAAVSFKILNNLNSNEEGKIHAWTQWAFRYWAPTAGGCPCGGGLPFEKTTPYGFNDLIWTSTR